MGHRGVGSHAAALPLGVQTPLLESLADPAAILDSRGLIIRVNEQLVVQSGSSREELLGHSPSEFTHPKDVPATTDVLAAVHVTPGVDSQLEKRYVRADGRVVWVRVTEVWRPELRRILGHVVDITETVLL